MVVLKTTSSSNLNYRHEEYWTRYELVKVYIESKNAQRTRETYLKELQYFFNWSTKKRVEMIKPIDMANYKNFLKDEYKPSSANLKLSVVRDFFSFLTSEGYIENNPCNHLKLIKSSKKKDQAHPIKPDDVKRMLELTSNDSVTLSVDRIVLHLMFYLGLRVSELANMKFEDIEIDGPRGSIITIKGKGSKVRFLPLQDNLKKIITQYKVCFENHTQLKLTGEDYVVQSYYLKDEKKNHKGCTIEFIRRIFVKYAGQVGIENIKTHSARVTAINFLLDAGESIRDTAIFAGHSSTSTTEIYDRRREEYASIAKKINY